MQKSSSPSTTSSHQGSPKRDSKGASDHTNKITRTKCIFSGEERKLLKKTILQHSSDSGGTQVIDWPKVYERFPDRPTNRIRLCWQNQLNPKLKFTRFLPTDDWTLFEGYKRYDSHWQRISNQMFDGTRSAQTLNDRFRSKAFQQNVAEKYGANAYADAVPIGKFSRSRDKTKKSSPASSSPKKYKTKAPPPSNEKATPKDCKSSIQPFSEHKSRRSIDTSDPLDYRRTFKNYASPELVTPTKTDKEAKAVVVKRSRKDTASSETGSETYAGKSNKRKQFAGPELSDEEKELQETILRHLDPASGSIQWNKVYESFPGRNTVMIRHAWAKRLNPKLDFSRLSTDDQLRLWDAHKELGNQWQVISNDYFDGTRSLSTLRSRFHSQAFRTLIEETYGKQAYLDGLAQAKGATKRKCDASPSPSSKRVRVATSEDSSLPRSSSSSPSPFREEGQSVMDCDYMDSGRSTTEENRCPEDRISGCFTRYEDVLLWNSHKRFSRNWDMIIQVFGNHHPVSAIKGRWYHSEFIRFVCKEYGPNAYFEEARRTLIDVTYPLEQRYDEGRPSRHNKKRRKSSKM